MGEGDDPGTGVFALPAGTVTFLLSDIEDSTRQWETEPDAMAAAVPLHYAILAEAVARHDGVQPQEQGEGDSIVAAFARASDALDAAVEAQRALRVQQWPGGIALRVRIALHTAEAQLRDEGNYFGVALSRCARLRGIAHGGQTLLSRTTHDLVADRLHDGVELADLGVHRLRDLGRPEHVFGVVHPDLDSGFAPLRSLDAVPNSLPGRLTSFVGRERELAHVRDVLAGSRMLTLTGSGGCGKTRLALQVAADSLDRFPDGVWWVGLADLEDADLVVERIAEPLAIRALPGQSVAEALSAHLSGRAALLVLDNCEHLLEACRAIAERLLLACPRLSVMATSRAPLGVDGETDWRVPSLALPPERPPAPIEALAQYDAVRLFIDRARAVRRSLSVTAENAPAIAQICHQLDGIPLAIELAAARVRMLSVEQIASGLHDRFRLLTGGARTSLPRHQTLRASVDWSHALLDAEERILFRRLAAFAGHFGHEAAAEVCADELLDGGRVLDLLAALVDKSLVVAEEEGRAVRYRLLETVRDYALGRLRAAGEVDAVGDRHRDVYTAIAERMAPLVLGREQIEALDALDADAANLMGAVERAIVTDPEMALRLCAALTNWWKLRGMFGAAEGAYSRALAASEACTPALRARVLWARSYLLAYAGEYETAATVAEEAIALAQGLPDRSTEARAYDVLGTLMIFPNPVLGRSLAERASALAREAGDDWCLCDATQIVAYSHLLQGDDESALRAFFEVLPLIERSGYREFVAWHWVGLALAALPHADLERVRTTSDRGMAAALETREPVVEGIAHALLGWVEVDSGRAADAAVRLGPAHERVVATGAGMALPTVSIALAEAELDCGAVRDGRPRLEAVAAASEEDPYSRVMALLPLARLHLALGEQDAAAARLREAEAGIDVLDNPWLRARARVLGGMVALGAGDPTAAESLAHEALQAALERRYPKQVAEAFEVLAEVAEALESPVEAARLLGAARRLRHDAGLPGSPADVERLEALAARLQTLLGEEGFDAALGEGRQLDPAEAAEWVRRARGSRRRPSTGWESLTPTERQVVALTAQGLTNPEIGARMFISPGTVKIHLSHIFGKLGLRNRSELAAEAMRRGGDA